MSVNSAVVVPTRRQAPKGLRYKLLVGDCVDVLKTLDPNSIDSIVTDPPHGVHAGDQRWDYFGSAKGHIGFLESRFREALRVLKPGGHLLASAAPRTAHRIGWAIESAGYEVRDTIVHLFAQGAAPSINVCAAIDKALGETGTYGEPKSEAHAYWLKRKWVVSRGSSASYRRASKTDPEAVERAARRYVPATTKAKKWDGWGTALRPAATYWLMARKPLVGRIEQNVLRNGVGALNIDATRLDGGGWPSNVAFAHGADCEEGRCNPECPVRDLEQQSPGASRFFYVSKPRKAERGSGNNHVAVQPVALLTRLITLVTPPKGSVLDLFAGTGSIMIAAVSLGMNATGIERDRAYAEIARQRLRETFRG